MLRKIIFPNALILVCISISVFSYMKLSKRIEIRLSSLIKHYMKMSTAFTNNDYSSKITKIRKDLLPIIYNVNKPDNLSLNFTAFQQNVFTIQLSGGGISILDWLINTPGCSQSLLKATVPYSTSSLRDILSTNYIKSYCSEDVAIKLSNKGFQEACSIYLKETHSFRLLSQVNIFSIACTAALATTRPKLGPHQCYIACRSSHNFMISHLNLKKDIRSREMEDLLCSLAIFNLIAQQCNISTVDLPLDISQSNQESETLNLKHFQIDNIIDSLYTEEIDQVTLIPKLSKTEPSDISNNFLSNFFSCSDLKYPEQTLIYCGSFNPIHEGHIKLIVSSLMAYYDWIPHQNKINPLVVFEISVVNADKPTIPKEEIFRRINTIIQSKPLFDKWDITNFAIAITSQPLFIKKSNIFKGNTFLVGADTMSRILNPKYYKPSNLNTSDHIIEQISFANMISSLNLFLDRKNRFIVGGRKIIDPKNSVEGFETLESIVNNSDYKDVLQNYQNNLFFGLSELQFRADLSSTDVRKGLKEPFLA